MQKQSKPILLFNDECAVCRHIGHWVQRSAQSKSGETSILVQPIGDDPERLRSLNPDLNIWDAYATGRGSRRGDSKEFAQHKMVRVVFRHHYIGIPALSSRAQHGLRDPRRCETAIRL
jgi:hypothetical protein